MNDLSFKLWYNKYTIIISYDKKFDEYTGEIPKMNTSISAGSLDELKNKFYTMVDTENKKLK